MDNRLSCLFTKHLARKAMFTPDGRCIAIAGLNFIINIYNIASKKVVHRLTGLNTSTDSLAVTPDNQLIITAEGFGDSPGSTIYVCPIGNNDRKVRKLKHKEIVFCSALSPDKQLLVTGVGPLEDNVLYVWRMTDGSLVRKIQHTNGYCLALTSDALRVVSKTFMEEETSMSMVVWRLTDGEIEHRLVCPEDFSSAAITPDNQCVLTECGNNIRVVSLVTGKIVRELRGHTENITSITVSPNGRLAASGSVDKSVRVWSLDNPLSPPLVLRSPAFDMYNVNFHPNSKQISTVCNDYIVRMWTVCKWSERDHQLFSSEFQALVFHLMCVKARLEFNQKGNGVTSRLPMVVWLQVFALLSEQKN